MAYTRATTDATTLKPFNGGNGGLVGDIVLTFEVAASTEITKGQFLKLSSNYATPCTATTDSPIGVALQTVDNSDGSAGDLEVSVLVRGIAQVNAYIEEDGEGSYDDALVPFTACGLSTDGTSPGQSVSCGSDPTIAVGTMLSTQAVSTTASTTVNALVYVDFLGNGKADI